VDRHPRSLVESRHHRLSGNCRTGAPSSARHSLAIDLLKGDAERSEAEIFRGIRLEHWPCLSSIIIELHDAESEETAEPRTLLHECGFEVTVTDDPVLRGTGFLTLHARRLEEPTPRSAVRHVLSQ
jgi:hypothetical protein